MGNTFVAYPFYEDNVAINFHMSLSDLVMHDRGKLIGDLFSARSGAGGLEGTRNTLMRQFLNESSCDWILMIDDDMGFKPTALEGLHAFADPKARPIVGGLCFSQREMTYDGRGGYRYETKPTIFDLIEFPDGKHRLAYRHNYPINGLVECDATGGAFVLIHRDVAKKVLAEHGPNWFARIPDPDGGMIGEDLSFMLKCRELGFPVHVFTGVRVTHQKTIWLGETDFWREFEPPPADEAVDVIVPVLHRPQNVGPFMQSLRASTGLASAWWVCEPGDTEQIAEVRRHGGLVVEHPGTFAEKVNHAYRTIRSEAPWVFLVGDDVVFHAGWLDHAEFVPKVYGGSVVGTNDMGNPAVMRGDHATHMMIRKSYIDEVGASWDGPGVVAHEGYRHWYVDNEIVAAARQRSEFQMALGSIVEHMHPLWGKGSDDDVYRLGQAAAERDAGVFAKRSEASQRA